VPWGPPAAPAAPTATRFSIGSVTGRTLDTYGSEWSLFLLIALVPATIVGLGVILTEAAGLLLVAGIPAGLGAWAMMTLATDDLWLGRRPALGALLTRTLRLSPRLVLGILALMAMVFGLALALTLGIVLLATIGGSAGAVMAFLLSLVAWVVVVIISIRWSLFMASLALDGSGPLAALNRSFALTRGHVWRVFGLFVVLLLLMGLAGVGGTMVSDYSPNRLLAAVATIIVATITTPVPVIAMVLLFGDLSGRGYADSNVVRAGRGRGIAAGLVVGLGLVLAVVGTGVRADAGGLAYDPDRGAVIAGHSQNIFDRCHPADRGTRFSTSDRIWLAAVFSESIPGGEEVTINYYRDGTLVDSASLPAGFLGMECFYEVEARQEALPATYRVEVTHEGRTIASGEFVVE
jgi:MFS family permease